LSKRFEDKPSSRAALLDPMVLHNLPKSALSLPCDDIAESAASFCNASERMLRDPGILMMN